MPARSTQLGSPQTMRLLNRTAAYGAIREHGPISRPEVARLTSISAVTAARIVDDLIRDGLVREVGQLAPALGRPARLVHVNENVVSLGCDLSVGNTLRLGLINLLDEVNEVQTLEIASRDPEAICDLIASYIDGVTKQKPEITIASAGIGVPGTTDVERGGVRWAPTLKWHDIAFEDLVSQRLDLPTVVDNDVNLALIGEASQGAAARTSHALLISFRDGIGGAVLIDGRLYRGRGSAGEVGYTVTGKSSSSDDFRSFGFMETAIARLLLEECERARIDTASLEYETASLVRLLTAKEGALKLSARTRTALLRTIASAVASATALLDPEVVVLSGWIESLDSSFLEDLERALELLVPVMPQVRYSELGPTATLIGGALSARNAVAEAMNLVPGAT